MRQRYSHYASVIAQSQIFNQSAGVEITKADCDPVLIQCLTQLTGIFVVNFEADGGHPTGIIAMFNTNDAAVFATAQISEQLFCQLIFMDSNQSKRFFDFCPGGAG